MKKRWVVSAALGLLASMAHGMGDKPSTGTGDKDFDFTLEKIRSERNADSDGFITRLAKRYNIPEPDIRTTMHTFHFELPDIFMATALADLARRPILTVAQAYDKNPGKGWGVVAKDLGIKPGSREFHKLKADAEMFLSNISKPHEEHEREAKQGEEHKPKQKSAGKGR